MNPASSASAEYDVVIIGGGIVGMTLAIALRHSDHKVLLIEQRELAPITASDAVFDERSIALSYVSCQILQRLGVWHLLSPHSAKLSHVHISEKGRFGITRLHAEDYCVDALGHVVPITALSNALSAQLATQANLNVLAPSRCTQADPDVDSVNLKIETADGSQEINSKLLVLADGAQSRLRQAMGINAEVTDYNQQALVCNVSVHNAHAGWAYERFTEEGPLALLPLPDDRFSLVWSGTPQLTTARMSCSDEEFLNQVQQLIGQRAGRLTHTGKREVFPLRQLLATRLSGQRMALIGNAAHTLHPVAGQGLNLALRDISALADLLQQNSDAGAKTLLKQYSQARHDDIRGTSTATDMLVRIFEVQNTFVSHARSTGLGVLDCLPALKQRVGRYGMGFRAGTPFFGGN